MVCSQFSLITLTALFVFSSPASSFVLVSGPLKAKLDASVESPTVTFRWDGSAPQLEKIEEFENGQYIDSSEAEVTELLLRKAFALWNDVPGAFVQLELETDPSITLDPEDHVNAITVSEIDSASSAAAAQPIVESNSKLIVDCDILISKSKTSVHSLAFTIAHELGHCLGLGHAHTNYGSIMGYSRDDTSLRLGADDIAGLSYLYPDPAYAADDPNEIKCGTISRRHMKANSVQCLALASVALLLFPLLGIGLRRPIAKTS